MRKTIILTLVLLISAVWLQAQSAKPPSEAGKPADKTSDLPTLEGCLQSSNGHYTLTEDDGTTHRLSGAANKLGHQVGRQIEVSGKPGYSTEDTTPAGAGSSAVEWPVFEVKSVKRIADKCKSATP